MKLRRWINYAILAILLIIGVYLRASGAYYGFFAFTYDQGKDFLTWHKIIYQKDLTLIGPSTGIDGVFHGVWWYWLIAPWFWLTSGDPKLLVTWFGIFSSVIIWVAFVLGRQIQDTSLGLLLAGIVAVSPFFVIMGSQLWHPNTIPLLVFLWLVGLWQYIKKGRNFFWIGFGLGAILEFELAAGSLILGAVLINLFLWKLLPKWKQIIFGLVGFSLWLIPRIIFEARHNFLQTKAINNFLIHPQTVHSNFTWPVRLGQRLISSWDIFNETFAGRNVYVGGIWLILLSGWIVLTYRKWPVWHKNYIRFLIGVILVLIFFASIYPDTLWGYYLVGMPALLLPIFGLGLSWVVNKQKKIGAVLAGIWLLYLWQPWSGWGKPWVGDASVYKNQIAVVDYIYSQSQGKIFNTAVYSPSLIDYNYQYLFLWYGSKIYGYQPARVYVLGGEISQVCLQYSFF